MMKYILQSFFGAIIFFATSASLFSQDKTVNVERCKALDQTSPIHNIWVDTNNIKWVANSNGLHKVLALDFVEEVSIPGGATSLLTIRGGNAQIEWITNEMQELVGNVNFTCGFYNAKKQTVWLGTNESGAYEFALNPLRIVQRLNTSNKKLTSNQVNDIFIRQNGTIYIATNDGMLTGTGDKWTLQERYINFVGVDAWGDNLWILGDNFLWQVDSRGKWTPIAIELRNVEGKIRDIAVDDEGRVWIASNMMTGYDVAAEKYQRFGPGQYFTSQFVNCLDVDQDGSIWTGTADKGLYLIQWESSLILTIDEDAALDCNSTEPTAALSVKVAGGQPPYTYQWSNGLASANISKLTAGEYQVTVSDASGLTKTAKHIIPDASITLTIGKTVPATGTEGGNGSATIMAEGGSAPYLYKWDNGEREQTAFKLASGDHSVTVTDKNGCSAETTFNISETITPMTVAIKTLTGNKCATSSDGELQAEVIGGKLPYQYEWNANNGKDSKLSSLSPGSYNVKVTDASGQVVTASTVLKSPEPLLASIEIILAANVNTSNGQALAKASGGKAPYTFKWDNGEVNAMSKTLAPGQNTLTVTDANGCTSVATINMTENISEMSITISQKGEIKCNGEAVEELKAEVTGGKGPYAYNWNIGQRTESIKNIKGGIYHVTVTDVTGSLSTATFEVKQPAPMAIFLQIDGAATTNKTDGRATAKAEGGTGAFDFAWDNGEKTNKATKLSPGAHTLTVTDGMGCSTTSGIEIPENILALSVIIDQIADVKCADDASAAIEAVVVGGKEPYTYKWSNNAGEAKLNNVTPGLFTLTVTDATGHTATTALTVDSPSPITVDVKTESPASTNESNGRAVATATGGKGKLTYLWDNGEKTARAEKLNAGSHTVVVTDENGCTKEATVMIPENILPLTADITSTGEILCAGQRGITLTATVEGGKAPFAYSWIGAHNGSTPVLTNMGAGTYTLKVTDATSNSIEALFEVTEPKPLNVVADKISPASTGNTDGEVVLKVTGGKLPYSFRNTTLTNTASLITADKLPPGTHELVVTDASGCTSAVTVTITEDILPLSASIKEARAVLCADVAGGSLEATAKGGKPPYSYLWGNGSTTTLLDDIAPGKYSVTVKDASGQEVITEHVVKAPPPMIVEVVNLRSATNDRISDGKGSVEIKGGAAPFTYSWSSGETGLNASKLPIGQGQIIVTDKNGCTASAAYIVKEKVLPELTASRLASGEPIRMEKIQFEADSVNINPEAIPSLDELYEFLYDNPTTIIEVAGHTNGLPADDYCDRISAERAQEVADYLINKGIESRRVISKGYGKRKPVATNQTPEGRKKNQRVEIRLIKIEE